MAVVAVAAEAVTDLVGRTEQELAAGRASSEARRDDLRPSCCRRSWGQAQGRAVGDSARVLPIVVQAGHRGRQVGMLVDAHPAEEVLRLGWEGRS